MPKIHYRDLIKDEMNLTLFKDFNRHQKVEKCWRKEKGEWVLKDIAFTEYWSPDEYKELTDYLKKTLSTGGVVFGAFSQEALIGFASVENELFGSNKEYLQLSCIHVSSGCRGRGIGKKLFELVGNKAKELGAIKLYISAHSSEESIAFYHNLGCVEATEYNLKLVAEEPWDCQLEYHLLK